MIELGCFPAESFSDGEMYSPCPACRRAMVPLDAVIMSFQIAFAFVPAAYALFACECGSQWGILLSQENRSEGDE